MLQHFGKQIGGSLCGVRESFTPVILQSQNEINTRDCHGGYAMIAFIVIAMVVYHDGIYHGTYLMIAMVVYHDCIYHGIYLMIGMVVYLARK